jgi:MFS family permease
MLVSSRFLQGIGEALAAPAALGLLVVLFPDPRERVKAVGIWGGLAGLGGTTGAVISGVLTDVASWRWIFYINVPVALFALLLVPRLVSESRMVREQDQRMDFAGAITAPGGLVAITYGLLQAASHPWGLPARAHAASRRSRAARRDGRDLGWVRVAVDPAQILREPHMAGSQLRLPVLGIRVL